MDPRNQQNRRRRHRRRRRSRSPHGGLPVVEGMCATQNKDPNSAINKTNCSHNWPKYPCYDMRRHWCQSTIAKDGWSEVIVDPINDIVDAVARSTIVMLDFMRSLIENMPPERRVGWQRKMRRFFTDYSTSFVPLPGKLGPYVDNARYLPGYIHQYQSTIEEHINRLFDMITKAKYYIQKALRGGRESNS